MIATAVFTSLRVILYVVLLMPFLIHGRLFDYSGMIILIWNFNTLITAVTQVFYAIMRDQTTMKINYLAYAITTGIDISLGLAWLAGLIYIREEIDPLLGKSANMIGYLIMYLTIGTPLKILFSWNMANYYYEQEDKVMSLLSEKGIALVIID